MAVFVKPDTIYDEPRRTTVSRRVTGLATSFGFVFSAAAHAALIALLLLRPLNDRGQAPDLSDATSIELVASQTLEAIESPAESVVPSAMPETSPPPSVEEVKDDRPDVKAVEVTQPPETQPETALDTTEPQVSDAKSDDMTQDSEAIRGTAEPDDTAPARRVTPEERPVTPPAAKRAPAQEKEATRKPVTMPRPIEKEKAAPSKPPSSVASVASKSKAAASRGDIAGYAARVRARVAGRRPSGNGVRGSVVISFSVSGSGGLGSARIAKSSGSGSLDAAALQAVRGAAPFPPPPGGRSLSFSVPFHYR